MYHAPMPSHQHHNQVCVNFHSIYLKYTLILCILDQSEVPVPTPPPIKRFLPRSASELKPIVSPSPSIRSKHQTLAQKLRSTGKSVKGYMNLNETPVVSECLTPSLSEFERITPMKPIDEVDSNIVSMTPRCWKTVDHLLELYATMPETKTVTQRISLGVDVPEGYKGTKKYDILSEAKSCDDIDKDGSSSTPIPPLLQHNSSKFFICFSSIQIFLFILYQLIVTLYKIF